LTTEPLMGARRCLWPREPPDAKTVHLDQLGGVVDLDVALRRRLTLDRFVKSGVAGDQPEPLGFGVQPVSAQDLVDPVGEILIPPHLARASSSEIRWGPTVGKASANANSLCSTIGEVALGIRGGHRSRG
jgi:hypothetical protein